MTVSSTSKSDCGKAFSSLHGALKRFSSTAAEGQVNRDQREERSEWRPQLAGWLCEGAGPLLQMPC